VSSFAFLVALMYHNSPVSSLLARLDGELYRFLPERSKVISLISRCRLADVKIVTHHFGF